MKLKYFLRKFRYNPKKSFLFLFLFLFLVSFTIGYAFLTKTLSIEGSSTLVGATWDIHFDNLVVTTGSVTATTEATITTPTSVTFSAQLENPGDFYEFTVDVVNEGTFNAMIDSIQVLPVLTSEQQEYLDYIVTYQNGLELAPKQRLDANSSETILVRFLYKEGVDESLYPMEDQDLAINFEVVYVQADGTEEDIICPDTCPAGTYLPTGSCVCIPCQDGYVANNNSCVEAVASNTVNNVTTYYLSLQEAINASTTGEAKLLKNTTENIIVGSSINKTINLNGKTLNGPISNDGTLTINGNGNMTSVSSSTISNHGTMTISNGTFTRTSSGWTIANYNNLTFNGGTVQYTINDSGAAIGNVGSSTVLHINGGTILSQGHAVAIRGQNYIKNATITSYNSYPSIASHESGYVEIENCTINGEIYNASGCSGDSNCSSSYPKNLTIIKGSTINGTITQHTDERTIRYYKDNSTQYSLHLFGTKITKCAVWTTPNQSDLVWYNASYITSWSMGNFYACFVNKSNHTTDSFTTHFYNNDTLVAQLIWGWE